MKRNGPVPLESTRLPKIERDGAALVSPDEKPPPQVRQGPVGSGVGALQLIVCPLMTHGVRRQINWHTEADSVTEALAPVC